MKTTYEVFDAANGTPVFTTRYRLIARIVAMFITRGDYAVAGGGWL